MAHQVDPATMGGTASGGATAHGQVLTAEASQGEGAVATANVAQLGPYPPFHGRTISWIAVSVVMVGFVIGGLALVLGHHGLIWWLFWTGAGVAVVGLLMSLVTNTFEDWY
ncbi:MAG TPA: hypothetical protein VMA95_15815 [Streptosporangiaceae bacterium]|nr:hypothetical protein [Streptosporangiaceae bacterium]